MSADRPVPTLLCIEPRRIHVLRPLAGRPSEASYTSEALAFRALPDTPIAEEMCKLPGWSHLRIENEILLLGDHAVRMAWAIPGCPEATYPLAATTTGEFDERSWRALRAICERVLVRSAQPLGAMTLLLPARDAAGRNHWLNGVAELLLPRTFAEVRGACVTELLLGEPSAEPVLQWAWVFESGGVSIAARWDGQRLEDHLDAAAGWNEHAPASSRGELIGRQLVEETLGASLAFFREAWGAGRRPAIELRIAMHPARFASLEQALARALRRHGIEGAAYEWMSHAEMLRRGLALEPHAPLGAGVALPRRPQAIRPRARTASRADVAPGSS